ncbi:hypothetical protein GGS24DRAFT_502955 [Hypoxylon argillaceum]|nr:hypothetical protein GGS24DRAFT_502955 [Hypoxylon argillaceum]
MAVPNSLLGPILGGLLGFLGTIGAAIIALVLARRERVRRMDEERILLFNGVAGLMLRWIDSNGSALIYRRPYHSSSIVYYYSISQNPHRFLGKVDDRALVTSAFVLDLL